ncbi:MAG: glycosyltransferase family 4 protein [Nitrospinota bacterium]
MSRWLFGRADAAIAPNSHIARLLRERGALPPERIREVRGGVDVSAFCPLSAEERRRARAGLGAEPDELLVGILARLQPRRRHADLLEAFVAVRREIPRARLLIAGKGEGRGGLEARTARLRLKDAVTFTGYWEGDLREVLGALDLFVLLAPGSDGSGRALLEAQAVGLASLAVDREGLADAVEKGVTAHVVPAGGPRPLAEALTALLRDPGRRESLGRAARRRALEELDWAHVAGHVEAIYGECLERLRSRCGGGGGRSGRAAPSSASRHLEREVAGR